VDLAILLGSCTSTPGKVKTPMQNAYTSHRKGTKANEGLQSPGQSSENFRPSGEILTWP